MKPFNLEAAKNGAPVVTRDGKPVRIICTDFKRADGENNIIVLEDCGNHERINYYPVTGKSGRCFPPESEDSFDLCMATVERTGWVILRTSTDTISDLIIYPTRNAAEAQICHGNTAIAKITWEE